MNTTLRLGTSAIKKEAKALAKTLRGGEVIALIGQLGSGKTTFTQELAKALGVKQRVLSPTFIVLQEFPTQLRHEKNKVILAHLDLYRTRGFAELKALGMQQLWGQANVITIIEWADKIKTKLPSSTIYIYLHRDVD